MAPDIRPVEVLGCAVGNLWDLYILDKRVGRVTYHGNALVSVREDLFGNPWQHFRKFAIAAALDNLYTRRKL